MKTKDIENIYSHWYKKSVENSFEEIQQNFYKLAAKYKAKNIAKSFKSKNSFKGKIGIFDIKNNKINHRLNFYQVDEGILKEIF